jgi:hypothetical protein
VRHCVGVESLFPLLISSVFVSHSRPPGRFRGQSSWLISAVGSGQTRSMFEQQGVGKVVINGANLGTSSACNEEFALALDSCKALLPSDELGVSQLNVVTDVGMSSEPLAAPKLVGYSEWEASCSSDAEGIRISCASSDNCAPVS